ncbi:MAG: tRNA (adenosine(37)-N6)-threonylcarbamoyltransferase complex dimerization subunit type 1 TsaB [Pseudomonas marincola]
MTQKAMKILALDTALNACSVALVHGPDTLAFHHEERARGHAETLLPIIKSLMGQASAGFQDLDMIAVSIGPGTFTGLRIGLAAARGIAIASGKPCVGITTLQALAASVPEDLAKGRLIVPAIDARRKEIYIQTYAYEDGTPLPKPCNDAQSLLISDAQTYLGEKPLMIIGSGGTLLKEAGFLNGKPFEISSLDQNPDARIIAALAHARGRPDAGSLPPAPLYLRGPDAKLPGGITPPNLV